MKKRTKKELFEFNGCAFNPNGPKPIELTREQSLQLVDIIYASFLRLEGQKRDQDQTERKVHARKRLVRRSPRRRDKNPKNR